MLSAKSTKDSTYPFSKDVVGEICLRDVRGFIDVQTAVDLDRSRSAVQAFDIFQILIAGSVPASSDNRVAQRRLQMDKR